MINLLGIIISIDSIPYFDFHLKAGILLRKIGTGDQGLGIGDCHPGVYIALVSSRLSCYIFLIMTIEQTVAIPADYRIFLELPRFVPIGANARVSINIPTESDSQNGIDPVKQIKSYRGILKGRGISVERLRELQREDKTLEAGDREIR